MTRIVSIFLLLSILISQSAKLVVFVNFEINKNTIAKTKCVQRFKKKNTCKGSCHLKKQLKKAEDAESKGEAQVKTEFEGLVPNTGNKLIVKSNILVYSNGFILSSFVLTNKYISLLDRPPAAA